MTSNSVFFYSSEFLTYKFKKGHPFDQLRVLLTLDLLKKSSYINESHIKIPREATDDELLLAHSSEYIQSIRRASNNESANDDVLLYGINTEDTPSFKNMDKASRVIVGATLDAVDYVMTNIGSHAMNLGGGLHHAHRSKASGFCIYNDISIAIEYITRKYGLRVLYIDTDAHHGDGVQWNFYDRADVCTVSIHETGRYLYPGTGAVNERGKGTGYGYCFNVPLDAYTQDESFLKTCKEVISEVAEFFQPDIIITQNGVDAHHLDPLTHLSTSMKPFIELPYIAHELAHKYCNGRWVAVGGGGYDIWRVVPRAWSYIWTTMTDQGIPIGNLPESWINDWQPLTNSKLPSLWHEDEEVSFIARKKDIEEKNEMTVQKCLQYIRNELKRQ
ncbi:MAG: acuC [Bacillales bacterium]|jgi:acetoin utilization protein AcuC|nr:acuC [Bacillales bacterium]